MISIVGVLTKLWYIISIAFLLFGIKISFLRNSTDPTVIMGCIFIANGIITLLYIFHFL